MNQLKRLIAVLFLIMALFCGTAYAEELFNVMNSYTVDDSITVFYKDPGQQADHVYIGSKECQDFTVEALGPMRTVVLVDNSLSIQEKYREGIKTFLKDLVAARQDGDTFTIATFSESVNYLAQDSSDYMDIKSKIEALTFVDQNSYLTKSLYTVIDDLEKTWVDRYTRIIVIADGAEEEALGYTDDELADRIEKVKIPVYTIGCSTSSNSEDLKTMFSLSRISNAKDYLIDSIGLPQILQDILNDTAIVKLKINPSAEQCDGTEQTIRLNFGENYSTTQVVMPFVAGAAGAASQTESSELSEAETEASGETSAQETEAAEETAEDASEDSSGDGEKLFGIIPIPKLPELPDLDLPIPFPVLIGIIVVLIVGIIVLVVIMVKRNKEEEPEDMDRIDLSDIGFPSDSSRAPERSETGTELLRGSRSGDIPRTEIINGSQSVVKLCLQDTHDPSKTFEYPLRGTVLIGRDAARCQIVINYNKYVSGVHCQVLSKDGKYVVRDGGDTVIASTNGTFVDGVRATPELPLPSGSVLKLGEVSFKVTYR